MSQRLFTFQACVAATVCLPSVGAFYKGGSEEACEEICLNSTSECDTMDCDQTEVCEFTCKCIGKCDSSRADLSFDECSTALKACFDAAPAEGYAHLDCWTDTCPVYYEEVKDGRSRGEWQGLGGWEVFPGALPELATPLAAASRKSIMIGLVGLASLTFVARMVLRRRRPDYTGDEVEDLLLLADSPRSQGSVVVE